MKFTICEESRVEIEAESGQAAFDKFLNAPSLGECTIIVLDSEGAPVEVDISALFDE